MKNIVEMNKSYAIIDMDTGTVLGTNLVAVEWWGIDSTYTEEILSSDSAAWEYGDAHGIPLFIDVSE